jgi:general secretion pathway protein C
MAVARRHRLAVELALLALVASLAAHGVGTALRTALDELPPAPAVAAPAPPPTAGPLADYAVIAERDVFNPPGGVVPTATADALRLWGVGRRGREAQAVIEDPATGRQDLYRVGDHVGDARITAIEWDRVTIAVGGREEVLALSPPATEPAAEAPPAALAPAGDARIRRTGENAFVVDRRALTGADSMSGLLTQLRAVAEVHDGRPAGFRLFHIRDDSLFARLGLRDGDVVQRVNGEPVAEPAALLAFLQRLGREPRVALDIVRADAPRTLVYDLR